MSEKSKLPADGTDRVTPEIREYLAATITGVVPLSRDFSRGLTFGQNTQYDAQGEGGMLEAVLLNMDPTAPQESDLFFLGAVLGSMARRDTMR